MPRKSKPDREIKVRCFYSLHPWRCQHHGERSEIAAYVEASGTWETVAIIPQTSGATSEALAEFIARAVNQSQQCENLHQAAIRALESVIEEGLTFTSEQEAERVIERLRKGC
jgi:predicted transcriptional regulator